MRLRFASAWSLSLLLVTGSAFARDVLTVPAQPSSFAEAWKSFSKDIPDYLAGAQCGGADMSLSAEGTIAIVHNFPGRRGVWNGDLSSGMANRDASPYTFPVNSRGFVTAFRPGMPGRITKTVWDDQQKKKVQKEFQSPSFLDPSCTWRETNGSISPKPIGEGAQPLTYVSQRDAGGNPVPQSPQKCEEFKDWLNQFSYEDCRVVGPGGTCCQWCRRYTASDGWIEDSCSAVDNAEQCPAALCEAELPSPGPKPAICDYPAFDSPLPNADLCTGNQCRCPAPGGQCVFKTSAQIATMELEASQQSINGWNVRYVIKNRQQDLSVPRETNAVIKDYQSYFRRYEGDYVRTAVRGVPNDKATNTLSASCFGFYEEFDPANRQTQTRDRRCTINIDVSQYAQAQQGRASIRLFAANDPSPLSQNLQRDQDGFQQGQDLWQQAFGGTFSLLNNTLFQKEYDGNLARLLLNSSAMDSAKLTASSQTDTAQNTGVARRLRPFDDTGSGRSLARWWAKQQTQASTIFRAPVVRLILPAALMSRNPFSGSGVIVERSLRDPRSQTIEVQLEASEDLLGKTFTWLGQSLLPLEQETMPVVLPLASPVELRALSAAWCMWYMEANNKNSCNDAPQNVKAIIARLNEYADAIDSVRELRTVLTSFAEKLLETQGKISEPLAAWVKQNMQGVQALTAQRQMIEQTLLPKWKQAEAAMKMAADANTPWCMNQRFTTPIYSLLDPWLPARKEGGIKLEQGQNPANRLPSLEEMLPQRDIIADLSRVRFMTGTIKIPVLQPVQLRLNLPKPPGEGGTMPEVPPALPDMSAIARAVRDALNKLPRVSNNTVVSPQISLPKPYTQETLTQISTSLDAITASIAGTPNSMATNYGNFWKSIGPLTPQPWNANDQKFAEQKRREECLAWGDAHCQHVETDLMERVQRIASRPGIQLREDFESDSFRRSDPSVCLYEHGPCSVQPSVQTVSSMEWNIFLNDESPQNKVMNDLRDSLRNLTMKTPVGSLPAASAPPYDADWEKILPALDNPPAIHLKP